MSEVIGNCRLCPAEGVRLLDSHIVSKAAYRRILDGPPGEPREKQPVKITSEASVLTNEQMREHLLCRDCEDRFGRWEAYAFPVMSQGDGTFPWLSSVTRIGDGSAGDSSGVDTEKLSLFAVSIFWRLSVSRHSDVRLGDYEPAFRSYLLGRAPFPAKAVLLIVLLDPAGSTYTRVDRSFHTFKSLRKGGWHVHRFAILGVDMRLHVGGTIPRRFRQVCFARSKLVAIRPADSLALEMSKLFLNSPVRGSLAARSMARGRR